MDEHEQRLLLGVSSNQMERVNARMNVEQRIENLELRVSSLKTARQEQASHNEIQVQFNRHMLGTGKHQNQINWFSIGWQLALAIALVLLWAFR
jgi:hypothetical protein